MFFNQYRLWYILSTHAVTAASGCCMSYNRYIAMLACRHDVAYPAMSLTLVSINADFVVVGFFLVVFRSVFIRLGRCRCIAMLHVVEFVAESVTVTISYSVGNFAIWKKKFFKHYRLLICFDPFRQLLLDCDIACLNSVAKTVAVTMRDFTSPIVFQSPCMGLQGVFQAEDI